MRTLLTSALCLLALQTGCSQDLKWSAVNQMIASDFPDVPTLTTDALAERLADSTATSPLLLDARSPEEYAVSHLPGARRVAPSADSIAGLDTLSRERPIVVYCSVGYRSARVTAHLRDQGFSNVHNLKGSIFRWANEGRSVMRGDTSVQAVHPYNSTWGTLLHDSLHCRTPGACA